MLTSAAQVNSFISNSIGTDGYYMMAIANASKDDCFTALANDAGVRVVISESAAVWNNHPQFAMLCGNTLYVGTLNIDNGVV